MRYQLVLDSMARMAANPGNLPALGTATDGLSNVTDAVAFDAKTALDGLKGFTGEGLTANASRNPDLNWTIDPVHTADQLSALQGAFMWVLSGAAPPAGSAMEVLLKDFHVYNDLFCLTSAQPKWFHVGCRAHAPKSCPYIGRYGDVCVWVFDGGTSSLSEFTLILTDIATVEPTTLHPTAAVAISQPGPNGQQQPLGTQQIPFRVNGSRGKRVTLLAPVVYYGPPDASGIRFSGGPANWCDGAGAAYRRFQSSSPNPALDYRNQQQQQQFQSQIQQGMQSQINTVHMMLNETKALHMKLMERLNESELLPPAKAERKGNSEE